VTISNEAEGRLQKYVIELLSDGKERSTNHVSVAMKHPQDSTRKVLEALEKKGLVTKEVRTARGRNGIGGMTNVSFWRATDAGS
jgi:predicted ArsR family transcriptional regulator